MSQKKYWKGLEEFHATEDHQRVLDNEFSQDLEQVNLSEDLLGAQTPRRDFLKFLGFSTLAATVAASCEMPVRKAIPYAIKPDAELTTPGVANYYASTYVDNGEYCAVVVKTADGRPILVEGNKSCAISKGGTTSRVVASTLSLYDTARLRGPMIGTEKVDVFADIDQKIISELGSASGQIVLLTGTIISPTTKEAIQKFIAKYPNARHIQFDPVSYSGLILANEASFGKKAIPSYHFENAKTIFSLGADFLGTWLSPAEFTHGYVKNRKLTAKNPVMSKHYQVEAMMSTTGANADERATCRPSEFAAVANALLNAVNGGAAPSFASERLNTLIVNAAKDLKAGNGLVVCGANDPLVQQLVNAINSAIGAYGTTISWAVTSNYKQGVDRDMADLVSAMNAGQVGALILSGVNPAYEYFDAEAFNAGLQKVKTTISLNDRLDETTDQVTYKVPSHHWLESWGDAEPKTGYYSFMQPTIAPLFKTRQFQDSLLVWAGVSDTYQQLFNTYWQGRLGGQNAFDKALQEGVVMPATAAMTGGTAAAPSAEALAAASKGAASGFELLVYESLPIGTGGNHSANPWLQELPDPITKATWDNYVMMSPRTAKSKEIDAELTGINQVDPKKRVVKVTVGNKTVELPVVVIPGMHNDVIAIAVGYGRSPKVGKASANVGKNAYPLVTYQNGVFQYANAATIEKTSNKYPVAITQTHHSYEARPIIREYTLEEFAKDPMTLVNTRRKELQHYVGKPWEHHEFVPLKTSEEYDARQFEKDYEREGTLYPVYEKQGIHWGMSIDLNACTGCGACVVACQAENNVSVVGKKEVLKVQEMSWIRIDRYFSGDPDDPDTIQTVFQPMMCQHCDNAPCENVCPVSATNHSSEGINQMAYNRCIGTKYCANNCPYKVRRFNWFDFNGADSIDGNLYKDGYIDDMNDDLTRMVLNPEVTVRSKGVMEKCSFCVQRLQEGKLAAKKEGLPILDRHISTACQTACASDCITFGNINDTDSAIYKERYSENKERVFYVLEHLHVLPNVNYLAKIRNTNEVIAGKEGKDGIYEQHI